MATVVYLDVEDEITSAATRIRTAADTRVGLVLPFGSRVATSRINFRLLAREAQANGRRLDIVAPDASARALAASAGLPVFASVGEYEAAIASLDAAGDVEATAAPRATKEPPISKPAGVPPPGAPAARSRTANAPAPGPVPAAPATRTDRGREQGTVPDPSRGDVPVTPSRRRGIRKGPIVVLLLVAVLLGAGATAAAVLLPSATITITPQITAVAPVSITVTADPSATEVDVTGAVIPATLVSIPVTTKGDFAATGKKITETNATGQVRFDSINTVFPVSVPRGTRVSTLDGVVFQTTAGVVVPRATVSGTTIQHGFASVGVAAVKAGTAGNVDAGTITQAPDTLGTQQISVTNPAATTGGTHTEQVLVAKKDVDAALAQLTKDLQAQFATEVGNPDRIPAGATLYPTTATLGDPVPTVDPATLAGKAEATFSLGLDATGTVVAVDSSPAAQVGQAALMASVTPGYQVVDGSVQITIGDGTVSEDGSIRIPVQATAREVRPLDANALKARVLGLSAADARAALAQYGSVDVVLWPGWVTSVPTGDGRVTLTINAAVGPSPGPSAAPTSTARPSGSPRAPGSPTTSPSASGTPAGRSPSASDASPADSTGGSPVPSG